MEKMNNNQISIEIIANHPRLLRHVPHSMKSRFQQVCAKLFNQYMTVAETKNEEEIIKAITNLLILPSYMLVRMGGGRKYRRKHVHKLRKIALSAFLDRMNGEELASKAIEIQNEVDQEIAEDVTLDEDELRAEEDPYAINRIQKS